METRYLGAVQHLCFKCTLQDASLMHHVGKTIDSNPSHTLSFA